MEAAQSVGMRRVQTLRLVVLPQAMRLIIPPTGNEIISMLKTSSLASVISRDRAAVGGRSRSMPPTTRPSRCSWWPASGTSP